MSKKGGVLLSIILTAYHFLFFVVDIFSQLKVKSAAYDFARDQYFIIIPWSFTGHFSFYAPV
jgi:hypothetical protein